MKFTARSAIFLTLIEITRNFTQLSQRVGLVTALFCA